jgi:hypothetical protein
VPTRPTTLGVIVARGLLGAADVGDGPTAEQVNLVQSLLHGYFGDDTDATTLDPMSPDEFAARVDPADRRRVVDLLVVLEFCRHADDAAQVERVEEYARALGTDEPFLVVARDALTESTERVMADWARFREPVVEEPEPLVADAALAARLRALAGCPAGSLGRAYFDFLTDAGIAFPGEEGGGNTSLVAHDFSHVLAGYATDAPSELALQAMLTSATGFEHHFSGLVASLALFESGKFDILDITPRVGALDRPGATAELAEAFRRGAACGTDFSAIDHLARADEPLERVRAGCGIPPRGA